MKRIIIFPIALFLSINLILTLFYLVSKISLAPLGVLGWLGIFTFLYIIYYFMPFYSKLNWFIYSILFTIIIYALEKTTFMHFSQTNYNFNHILTKYNNDFHLFIHNRMVSIMPNFEDFAININIFGILILFFCILYYVFAKNKFKNQIILNSVSLGILLSLMISTALPIKATYYLSENIGYGELSNINNRLSEIINYLSYSTVSIIFTIFFIVVLSIKNENTIVGFTLFFMLFLFGLSHIVLNYSSITEIILSILISLLIYFSYTKSELRKYNSSISYKR